MLTGELRNKIDKIWEIFWTGGITNPLSVIEQITYLLFIRGLDDLETKQEKDAEVLGLDFKRIFPEDKQHLRWSKFRHFEAARMYNVMAEEVFPFIKELNGDNESSFAKYMSDAVFIIPTPQLLEKVVTSLSTIPMDNTDVKGDLYEYLLSKISQSGTNGQFRTPKQIRDMMVSLMKPTPKDIIADPAAGTAGFLVSAVEYMRENHEDLFFTKELKEHFNNTMFFGYDFDRTMLRIAAMNMVLHGVENPNIIYRDSLTEQNTDTNKYTMVLANPPFKGSLDYESVSNDLLKVVKTKKTELLFLALFLRMLKPGGRCAVIVPDGVLFGGSNAHKAMRKEIIESHKLDAVISMPSGIFKPYAGVSTAILIFTKTGAGGTDKVWFYDMKADGHSLDDKRTPIEQNDIPDIIARFNNLKDEEQRKRTDQSFFVEKDEIVNGGYDLSINRYKEIEYDEVEYERPEVILDFIRRLENDIEQGINELEEMITAKEKSNE
ncbi:Type I restriction-modification system, DNA-methyltransferase subunit M [Candidatus Syntrophocurvum alkaliphilum]|uniref:site-specific DNA-methyltransferase (adenine-specific) n=1 Tax=Candidatus Syntrophocurvum alkaliphilum TaxID=2293317 RepID=A0A6I6DIS2_9FIRM|nr:class I SAM-dependent DNA methyltransferase [Candidatus Syntrophocurvum alkaliphilum]QGU00893.1 Type I restriction-modification system, DNA-methyltransferase subunit M [Candidatus Syntrophocurvum alkaliphilum]